MNEAHYILILEGIIAIFIAGIVWFLKDMNLNLKTLAGRVGEQNNRLGKLETWKDDHKEWVDDVKKGMDDEIRTLRERSHDQAGDIQGILAREAARKTETK